MTKKGFLCGAVCWLGLWSAQACATDAADPQITHGDPESTTPNHDDARHLTSPFADSEDGSIPTAPCVPSDFTLEPAGTAVSEGTTRRPRTVALDRNGILIDGHYELLRGGTVQWFRIPPEAWADRLRRFAAAGFNTLDMYIPWNVVEPEPGHFDFDSIPLARFLQLAEREGLYVVVRPGPFITNEMDGGGLPGWLIRRATKKRVAADGLYNIRTADPDFMEATGRYLNALGEVLQPYYATRGGPIVLYAIENEYTWFTMAHEIDKAFWYQGGPERPLRQTLDVRAYIEQLRDLALASGCEVPITTSPGDAVPSATGDTPGVAPFPSVYEWATPKQPEDAAYDLLTEMHDPEAHGGVYTDMPGGSTELARSAQEFRRLFSGGMDLLLGFNMVGMVQEGYLNSVTLSARAGDEPPHWGPPGQEAPDWLGTIFAFDGVERLLTGFAAPQFAYFHNVIDYRGTISPSGALRPLFYRFRRDNLFYDTVADMLAPLGHPRRSGAVPDAHPGLTVHAPELGARQQSGHTHYWFEGEDGSSLVFLVNQSGEPQSLGVGGIEMGSLLFPHFSTATVPVAKEAINTYAQTLVQRWPVTGQVRLRYSTSELLTIRDMGADRLLVLYGAEDSVGELSLTDLGGELRLLHADPEVEVHETGPAVTVTYPHAADHLLVLQGSDGQRLRVVLTTRAEAGHFWFPKVRGRDVLVAGPQWLEPNGSAVELSGRERRILVMSDRELHLAEWRPRNAYEPLTGVAVYDPPILPDLPRLHIDLQHGRVHSDRAEADPDYDDAEWNHWTGEPRPLEDLDIQRGHAWYRTELTLERALNVFNRGILRVAHAADIVGVYVNGHYLTTVSPAGTEIDSGGRHPHYRFESPKPYLHKGRNVIAFRTEIWGHGSFMFGRGNLLPTKASLPSVGYEGLKGLYGRASVGGHALRHWSARAGLGGERAGFFRTDFDDSNWDRTRLPINLSRGDVRWFRVGFDSANLPSTEDWFAPVSAVLEGENCKATVFLNGRLIGRWLSDDGWLQKGVWASPQRNMWNHHQADHFPLPSQLLRPAGETNVLAVALEDASPSGDAPGRLAALGIEYNQEQIVRSQEGRDRRATASRYRLPLTPRFRSMGQLPSQPQSW